MKFSMVIINDYLPNAFLIVASLRKTLLWRFKLRGEKIKIEIILFHSKFSIKCHISDVSTYNLNYLSNFCLINVKSTFLGFITMRVHC